MNTGDGEMRVNCKKRVGADRGEGDDGLRGKMAHCILMCVGWVKSSLKVECIVFSQLKLLSDIRIPL